MFHFLFLPILASSIGMPDTSDDEPLGEALSVRGVVEARHTADIAAPLAARLTAVPFREGTAFSKDAVIARFDCAAMEAERDALVSAHSTLSIRHETQAELHALGAAGELELRLARSEMEQAASETRAIESRLKDCTLHAPWAGRVVERHMQAHETPTVGAPIYSLIRSGASEIVMIVPAALADRIESGDPVQFKADGADTVTAAEVIRLGATVDAVSQTFEVVARPTGRDTLRPGTSGTARFAPKE